MKPDDVLYPPWLFEIHRPRLRLDSQKPETRARQVLAWAMRESEMNYLAIAAALGCSRSRAYELARGGIIRIAAAGARGDLEEDFQPADVRRECRRIAALRIGSRARQCPCDGGYCTDPSCDW